MAIATPARTKTVGETEPMAVSAAEVVHQGEKLILPESMSCDQAIDLLQRRRDHLEQDINIIEAIQCFPWDGAAALEQVLINLYGWAPAVPTGWFGQNPPTLINVEVALGKFKSVPWGTFKLPNVPGSIKTEVAEKDGQVIMQLSATTKRSHEKEVRNLFAAVREYVRDHSIYRGQALRIRFYTDTRQRLAIPEIRFIDTNIDENMLVYKKDVDEAVRTNLFTPIQRMDDCIKSGIPFKRGILLGGTYGTGKTMAAKVAAKYSVQAGLTFISVDRADELVEALAFARMYQSPGAVLFCEDIDRVMSGERSIKMDDILNIVDGIDSKTQKIMVVLTTNDLLAINPAMLRPGRLDAVIEITPPDAEACERLLRAYGGARIQPSEDLSGAGAALEGQIPAVVYEALTRAKLAQVRRQAPGEAVTSLSGDAIAEAAKTLRTQCELLNRKPAKHRYTTLGELMVLAPDEDESTPLSMD